jgi:hypothetical protein
MFHGLGDVNHYYLAQVVEQVVLRKITMDQAAHLVKIPHHSHTLLVEMGNLIFIFRANHRIFEPRGSHSILANKFHYYHIIFQEEGPRRPNLARHRDSLEVSNFFLGPQLDLFPWVSFAVAFSESELTAYISLTIFEDKDTRLENLDSELKFGLILWDHLKGCEIFATPLGKINIGFLARRDASVELVQLAILLQFMQNNQGPRVQNLVHCRTIILVLSDGVMRRIHLIDARLQLGLGSVTQREILLLLI